MPVKAKLELSSSSTDIAGTMHAHTGYGFTPSVLIPFMGGNTTASAVPSTALGFHKRGVGGAVSPAARHFVASQSVSGQAAADSDQGVRLDAMLANISSTGTWDGLLDLQSMDADGWTDVVDSAFSLNFRFHCLGLNTAVELVNVTEPAATGNQTITLADGREPRAVMIVNSPGCVNPPTIVTDSRFMTGWATKNGAGTIKNGILLGGSDNGQVKMVTRSYCRAGSGSAGDCIAGMASDFSSITSRARFTAFTTGGATLNWLSVIGDGTRDYLMIFFYEGNWDIMGFETLTNTLDDIVLNLSGVRTPIAGMVLSNATIAGGSAEGVMDAGDKTSFGAFAWNETGVLEQGNQTIRDEDTVTDSVVTDSIRGDSVYANIASNSFEAYAEVRNVRNQNELRLRMLDAEDVSGFFAFAVVVGDELTEASILSHARRSMSLERR